MRRDHREELQRALGLENSAYEDAGEFKHMLCQFNQLDKRNSNDVDYDVCSVMLLMSLFHTYNDIIVDNQQRCLWAVNVRISRLPKILPPNVTHIRRIRTEHYYWHFSTLGGYAMKRVDIRKPRGRLAVLDLVCPIEGRSISSVFRCGPSRALRNKTSLDRNKASQPVDIENIPGLETQVGKLEIADT